MSIHVAHLRKELQDRLFTPTRAGLAFTAGGLRLASRASELLGLQDLTVREVTQAGHGRRLLRLTASSIFAEHAAPGLIELFAARADDLDVELSVRSTSQFAIACSKHCCSRPCDQIACPPHWQLSSPQCLIQSSWY